MGREGFQHVFETEIGRRQPVVRFTGIASQRPDRQYPHLMEGQGTVHAANQGDYAQAAASRPGNSRTASANSRTKPPEKDWQEGRIPEKAVREKREDGNLSECIRTPCPQQDHCGQTAAICAPVLRAGTYPRLPQQVAQRAASTGYQAHGPEHSGRDAATGGEAGQDGQTVTGHSRRAGGVHAPAARRLLHDYTPGHGTHKPLQEKAGGNNRAIRTYRRRKRGADRGKKKNHADRDP